MSRLTVTKIMQSIAATVNQESTAPTAGGDEYNLWLEYINRALFEWANATDWEVLRKTFYPSVTIISGATIPMPLDFRKIAAEPRLYTDGIEIGIPFPEILPEQTGLHSEITKYITVRGDTSAGYNILFHPATMSSGASLEVQYYSTPTSLATTTEIPVIPDSQFLVDRTIAYIFEARSDSRFQLEENKARDKLLNMIENNNATKYDSYAGQNPVLSTMQKSGFRVGRD